MINYDHYVYKRFIESAIKRRHSNEWFLKKCKYLGSDYVLINKYTGLQNKVTFFHKKCGHHWNVYPDAIVYKQAKCNWCRTHRGLSSLQKFCEDHDLEILSPWAKHHGVMKFKSKKCGHIFYRRVGNLRKSCRCPYCNGYRQKENVSKLGKEILKWRHKKRFTQVETANLFHVSPKTISDLERGYTKPTKEQETLFKYYMNSLV